MEQVFLARPGETGWNRIRRRQGQLNSPLTAEGLAGAHRIAALVATLPIDSVLSSPLGRASETASVVLPRWWRIADPDGGEMSRLIVVPVVRLDLDTRSPDNGENRRRNERQPAEDFKGDSGDSNDIGCVHRLEYRAGDDGNRAEFLLGGRAGS